MNALCFVCGKPINDNERKSSCKLIPRSVYKWVTCNEGRPNWFVKGNGNRVDTHYKCAYKQRAVLVLPSSKRLRNLTPEAQSVYRTLYFTHQKELTGYVNLVHKVLAAQKSRCAICNKKIDMDSVVLRRIKHDRPRTASNACAVCPGCNSTLDYMGRKHSGSTGGNISARSVE